MDQRAAYTTSLVRHPQKSSLQHQPGIPLPPLEGTNMYHPYLPFQPQSKLYPQWEQPFPPQYQDHNEPLLSPSSKPPRTALRAALACEHCRAKKAKCDEARPSCSNCEQTRVICEYRDLPPPKQVRSMLEVTESVQESLDLVRQEISRIRNIIDERLPNANDLDATLQVHSPPNLSELSANGSSSTVSTHRTPDWRPMSQPLGKSGITSSKEMIVRRTYVELHATAMDMLQGTLAIPPVHSTAAHDLRNWPTITDFFDGVDKKYVSNGERNHNLDLSSHTFEGDTDDTTSTHGRRGHVFDIDRETALSLLNSYSDNIHILQPFMDLDWLREKVEEFVQRYCSAPTQAQASHFCVSEQIRFDSIGPHPNGVKRRKSSHVPPTKSRASFRKPIQRSVDNAIVLLVFALGKICQHKGPLPAPRPGFDPSHADYPYSPADSARSISRPLSDTSPVVGVGTQKLENLPPQDDPRSNAEHWTEHLDNLPGAAYFSLAVSILGEVLGANSIHHVQAYLLAGLFLAQLVRPYDSWKWINAACIAWLMLFKRRDENVAELSDEEKLTYWACLICESDILAELEMVPSGLSKLEDTIPINFRSNHHDASGLLQMNYLAQISIRKILNRAHSALYDANKTSEGGNIWGRLTPAQLAQQLEDWRDALPEPLKWNDDDPPADTINGARLRGKYFGARNIIFRPFLHCAINDSIQPSEAQLGLTNEDMGIRSENVIFNNAFECIQACKNSTVAFDNVPGMRQRLIVTNIFGTAHAQFGNMLVLGAAGLSPITRRGLPALQVLQLLNRTSEFLGYLAPLSPTMATNVEILKVVEARIRNAARSPTGSATLSFSTV